MGLHFEKRAHNERPQMSLSEAQQSALNDAKARAARALARTPSVSPLPLVG